MIELVRVPLDNGEVLVAEVDRADITKDAVELAAAAPGKAIGQFSRRNNAASTSPGAPGRLTPPPQAAPGSSGQRPHR
ncbi:hypothetical protein ACFQ1S_14935 [Kibdelosporangium lantanae]|uniref:Uncharacterized protein n=1 Tax=Kibdelosporangium lantanae TaxID=1497396 RepID=A0ABW3M9Q6_9PSEU